MEQKKRRRNSSHQDRSVNDNRNVRSINNRREVSRRSKGKDRYFYEDNRRDIPQSHDDYYHSSSQRLKQSSAKAAKRLKENEMHKSRESSAYDNGRNRQKRRRARQKNGISKAIGIMMVIVQFVLSVVLVVNVLFFNMLTNTYIMILIGVLLILLGITLLTQIGARGKGIGGKIFCLFLCVVLGSGSFYIGKVYDAIQKVVGSDKMTSSMVVAVRVDDSAEKLEDTVAYTYGVQYATGGEQMRSVIRHVEKELGQEIQKNQYDSMIEEAKALLNDEVDAIVYNSGQTGIIEEQIPTFSEEVRVIYTHKIVAEIENDALDTSVSEPFAVYLSGMDTYEEISSADRSDVNIVAVVNPKSHQVLLVTTPRDYYVPIPNVSGGQEDKLTHAGIYGVEASMATLEELYELDIQFFGRVNFTSMINIVDALGGLDVESDAAFTTSADSEHIMDVKEGMNHFNGKEALAFCRERHNLPDGDNARGRHQQAVITAIIKKMVSPAMLRGAIDIIETVSDGVDTNMSMEQIQSLIKTQLRTNAKWNIYSVSAEGTGSKDICYSSGDTPLYVTIPDETSVANIIDLINRVEEGEVLEGSAVTEQ